MNGRRDRARLEVEYLRDALVVEVAVIAEEEDKPLALRQRGQRLGHPTAASRIGKDDPFRRMFRSGLLDHLSQLPSLVVGRVYDRSPEPRVEGPLATPLSLAPERRRKGILHRILGSLAVVQDRVRHAAELIEPAPVDDFDLVLGRAIRDPLTPMSYLGNLLK